MTYIMSCGALNSSHSLTLERNRLPTLLSYHNR